LHTPIHLEQRESLQFVIDDSEILSVKIFLFLVEVGSFLVQIQYLYRSAQNGPVPRTIRFGENAVVIWLVSDGRGMMRSIYERLHFENIISYIGLFMFW
jgi:hypothetical protein